jgi:CRP/FNR family transcriptional regulator
MGSTSHRCMTCPHRRNGICAVLSDEQHKRLSLISRRRVVPLQTTIFADGDEAEFYANILNGLVKLVKPLGDGRQHIIGLLSQADFLGQPFGRRHAFSAEAETDVELCIFPRAGFLTLMAELPQLQRWLLQFALRELDSCRDWNLLLSRKQSYERVASFILMMAKRIQPVHDGDAQAKSVTFVLPMSRAEIADYLGLTLETVSRQMTQLKRKKLITLTSSREVCVPDLQQLSAIAKLEHCGQHSEELRSPPMIQAAG